AILLIRPEELVPDLRGLSLYQFVIVLCILTSVRPLLDCLRPSELARQPVTVCVLGVWVAGVLSQLMRGQLGLATGFASEFGKVVLYYLLLVCTIDTPRRLRTFLGWAVVFTAVLTGLALLQFHEIIDSPALRPLERTDYDPLTGEAITFPQLRSTGI